MAMFSIHKTKLNQIALLAFLGESFLSSKHQDYLAVIAEFWSAVRA